MSQFTQRIFALKEAYAFGELEKRPYKARLLEEMLYQLRDLEKHWVIFSQWDAITSFHEEIRYHCHLEKLCVRLEETKRFLEDNSGPRIIKFICSEIHDLLQQQKRTKTALDPEVVKQIGGILTVTNSYFLSEFMELQLTSIGDLSPLLKEWTENLMDQYIGRYDGDSFQSLLQNTRSKNTEAIKKISESSSKFTQKIFSLEAGYLFGELKKRPYKKRLLQEMVFQLQELEDLWLKLHQWEGKRPFLGEIRYQQNLVRIVERLKEIQRFLETHSGPRIIRFVCSEIYDLITYQKSIYGEVKREMVVQIGSILTVMNSYFNTQILGFNLMTVEELSELLGEQVEEMMRKHTGKNRAESLQSLSQIKIRGGNGSHR